MKSSTRRQVRFSEEPNAVFLLEDGGQGRSNECDCGERSQHRPRRNVWKQLQEAANEMKQTGYGILLRDSFGGNDDVTIQQNLNAFAQTHGRGLERHLSHKHDEERHFAKDNATRAVLGLQKVLRGNETSSSNLWNRLAYTLQVHSEDSKTFAQRLAAADAVAATEDPNRKVDAFHLVRQMHNCNARRSVRRPSIGDLLCDCDLDSSSSESEDEGNCHLSKSTVWSAGANSGDVHLGIPKRAEEELGSVDFGEQPQHKMPRIARSA